LEIESTPGKKGSKRFLAEFADAWLSMTVPAGRRLAVFSIGALQFLIVRCGVAGGLKPPPLRSKRTHRA
jgi:hypothetical protein